MEPCTANPYGGKEKYVFVSFCHKDEYMVFPIIEALARRGYRIWYDRGIVPGDEWTETIADKLNGCSVFMVMRTQAADNSHNCRNEITLAVELEKDILCLQMDGSPMSLALRMQLGRRQWLKAVEMSTDEIVKEIDHIKMMKECRGDPDGSVVVIPRTKPAEEAPPVRKLPGSGGKHWQRADQQPDGQPQEDAFRDVVRTGMKIQPQEEPTREPVSADVKAQPQEEPAREPVRSGVKAQPQEEPAQEPVRSGVKARPQEEPVRETFRTGVKAQPQERRDADETIAEGKPKAPAGQRTPSADGGRAPRRASEPPAFPPRDDAGATLFMDDDPDMGKTVLIDDEDEEDPNRTVLLDSPDEPKRPIPVPAIIRLATGESFRGMPMQTIVGRDERSADIVIPSPSKSISRSHFSAMISGGRYFIADQDSANGTFVDGERLEKGKSVETGESVQVRAAEEELIVLFGGAANAFLAGEPIGILRHMASGEYKSIAGIEPLLLGREHAWKDGCMDDTAISRNHASIRREDGGFVLEDTSTNGTTVIRNGTSKKLKKKSELLEDGDTVVLNRQEFEWTVITYRGE